MASGGAPPGRFSPAMRRPAALAPGIAEREAGQRMAAGPDRAEAAQHSGEDGRCLEPAVHRLTGEMVEEIADPSRAAEERRLRRQRLAKPAQQRGAAGETD